MDASYSYQADARTIKDRFKYREDTEPTAQLCNIAVDPRIYRGSTYERRAAMTEQVTKIPSYKGVGSRTRNMDDTDMKTREGFIEALVQTDEFDPNNILIVKHEEEVAIQTDPYQEKPIIHKKPQPTRAIGIKTAEPGLVLFDFDNEVKPFVTTLVQKAIAQASMEVHEEEELANMQRYLKAFEQNNKVEQQAIQRLEEAEAKKYEEKEKIVKERMAIHEAELEVRAKILARGFAEWYAWDIADDVIEHLRTTGYFYDEIEREIEQSYLPMLTEQTLIAVNRVQITDTLSRTSFERTNSYYDELCNRVVQVVEEKATEEKARTTALLRKMIKEDIVGAAVRKAKAIRNKMKPQVNEEEEDKSETDKTESTEDTGTSYDSA